MGNTIKDVWEKVEDEKDVYLLLSKNTFILEAPDIEDVDNTDAECILRLFSSYEEAVLYCEYTQPWYPEDQLEVAAISLPELFSLLDEITKASMDEYGLPARFDISVVDSSGWAKTVDTLWSTYRSSKDHSN